MKKGLKFWSKLLIASFFLGGMATSAIAQGSTPPWTSTLNGTSQTMCADAPELTIVTRTVEQLSEGTDISLTFSGFTAGDEYFFVAQSGTALAPITCGTLPIGTGLSVGTITGETFTVATPATDGTGTEIPAGGEITVAVKSTTTPTQGSFLYLGVYVRDIETGCYSDLYYVTIQVIGNVYAELRLNKEYAKEYICNNTTTKTNIGFDLCGIPSTATNVSLGYTLKLTADAGITGATLNDGHNIDLTANNPDTYTLPLALAPGATTYSLYIGEQSLQNTNLNQEGIMKYEFLEGLDKFYLTYRTTDNRDVTVPILFVTDGAENNCDNVATLTDAQKSHYFEVYVAPSFGIETKLYADAGRETEKTDPFCQGTIAYLGSTTTATTGTITNWTWSVDVTSANTAEAGAKIGDGTTTPLLTYDATTANERVNNRVQVGELTKHEDGVYKYTLTAKWDDGLTGNYDTLSCLASHSIEIQVNAAPILLVATETDNTTDYIDNEIVCPGAPIKILALEEQALSTDAASREDYIETGKYVDPNTATIAYEISYAEPALKAYTTWRSDVAVNATLDVDPHYLDNANGTEGAVVTYTIYNQNTTTGCKLVKIDGSSLPDGKAKINFPVSIRPTFGLTNNN